MTTADAARLERRARRAWIAEHHPDRGGDTNTFVVGFAVAAWRADVTPASRGVSTAVYRRPGPAGMMRRVAAARARRDRGRRPSRHVQ